MIRIKILSGPHAGKEREVTEVMNIPPQDLLEQLWQLGSHWEIDYSHASQAEMFDWGRADLVTRCMRALFAGLPVTFLGEVYQTSDLNQVPALASKLDDAIGDSGYVVTFEQDDRHGLTVVAVEREHKLQ